MKTALFAAIIALMLLTGCQATQIAGATIATQTFTLPGSPDDSVALANTQKLFIWDTATGNLAKSDTGVVTSGCTLAEAAIAIAAHGESTLIYTATIPPLDNALNYAMALCTDNAPASGKAGIILGPWRYDPETNNTFSDTNNARNGSIFTQNEYR